MQIKLRLLLAFIVLLLSALTIHSCGSANFSISLEGNEAVQQLGDTMASIDESAGNALGMLSFMRQPKTYDLIPRAYAVDCSSIGFAACTNNEILRDFAGCAVDSLTFTGTITLSFSDSAVDGVCLLDTPGQSVVRVPNLTASTSDGSFAFTKTGTIGQTVTKTVAGFNFTNDGTRRQLMTSEGSTIFDSEAITTSPITFTGNIRDGRVITGGTVQVTNNDTGNVCTFTPSNPTYELTCNCATSGSWSGTCSDGNTISMTMTGCGTADLTSRGQTNAIVLDRCYGI